MYYAVDTSSETVHAFRTCSYRDSYVISNYEAKAVRIGGDIENEE